MASRSEEKVRSLLKDWQDSRRDISPGIVGLFPIDQNSGRFPARINLGISFTTKQEAEDFEQQIARKKAAANPRARQFIDDVHQAGVAVQLHTPEGLVSGLVCFPSQPTAARL